MAGVKEYTTASAEETIALGRSFGKTLPANSIICFSGDLAAGKTTFIKGIASSLTAVEVDDVNSPTFVYLNIYEGARKVFHFDLYRLKNADEFLALGFDEYLDAGGVSCIEWSERINSIISPECVRIEMKHMGGDQRKIVITYGSMND